MPRPCPLDETVLRALGLHPDDLDEATNGVWPPMMATKLGDGSHAYKLARLGAAEDLIREHVESRLAARRHKAAQGLPSRLGKVLGPVVGTTAEQELESRARQEKVAAIAELHDSRIAVLSGPAGTGKTTLLKVLAETS